MNRKYIYFVVGLSIIGLLLIVIFFAGNKNELQAADDSQEGTPAPQPFITGTGVVEPASGNIMINSPFLFRSVDKIHVAVNQPIRAGDVLFQVYNQDLKIQLKIKQKKYEESLLILSKLEALPRQEDLAIAQGALDKAFALYNASKTEYCMTNRRSQCRDPGWMRYYKYQQAEADLLVAQARFGKVQSGAWLPDLRIAHEIAEQNKGEVELVEAELERTYIRSPIDGSILQIKIHEGEIPELNKTTVIVGSLNLLNLRVAVDQLTSSRFRPDSRAVAFIQGDRKREIPLKFLHMEPTMVPKKYLTNELTERVDTQTFEILYRIEVQDPQLRIGELMDVYIYL